MALAYLCSAAQRRDPHQHHQYISLASSRSSASPSQLIVADNPVQSFHAIVVDHALRPGSDEESRRVVRALQGRLGLTAVRCRVAWKRELRRAAMARQWLGGKAAGGVDIEEVWRVFNETASQEEAVAALLARQGNLETAARRARYRILGRQCAHVRASSLLLAHHEDDKYETVLMRLALGHTRARGLGGVPKARNDIPECEGIFGVDRSGYLGDGLSRTDYEVGSRRPSMIEPLPASRRQRRALRGIWSDEWEEAGLGGVDGVAELLKRSSPGSYDGYFFGWRPDPALLTAAADADRLSAGWATDGDEWIDPRVPRQLKRPPRLDPAPLEIEDEGVFVYRPLLSFAKDRLVATCEANDVPWFEDETNKDPTLTMRNAIRHMYQGFTLPKALQKPSILALAERCRAKNEAEDAEAARVLASHAEVVDFDPNVGTAIVRLPDLQVDVPRARRGRSVYNVARLRLRRERLRTTGALMLRRVLSLVSPEAESPPVPSMMASVTRVWPHLSEDATADRGRPSAEPKAFNVAGVLFTPVSSKHGESTKSGRNQRPPPPRYHLSRTPFVSSRPPPTFALPYTWPEAYRSPGPRAGTAQEPMVAEDVNELLARTTPPWLPWSRWRLWDGRFWLRIRHRLPGQVVVAPFPRELNTKQVRETLTLGGGDDESSKGGDAVEDLLRRFAPGKVRYTLPAIYCASRTVWERIIAGEVPRDVKDDGGFTAVRGDEAAQGTAAATEMEEDDEDEGDSSLMEREEGEDDNDQESSASQAASQEYEAVSSSTVTASEAPSTTANKTTTTAETSVAAAGVPNGQSQNQLPPTQRPHYSDADGRHAWEQRTRGSLHLLALPTVGVQVHGLENWLRFEARFRRVDRDLLALVGSGSGKGVSDARGGALVDVSARRRRREQWVGSWARRGLVDEWERRRETPSSYRGTVRYRIIRQRNATSARDVP